MNIELPPKLTKFVEDEIKAGHYGCAQDVITAALFQMQSNQPDAAGDIESLRNEIRIGVEQADRGELADWDPSEISAEGRRQLGEMTPPPLKKVV